MIHVKDLSFTYPKGDSPTLKKLSFDIEEGEIFGFLGPSGAGKSTAQKILYKLLEGYEGEISIAGKNLEHWGKEYYERIGVGFELPNHYLKLSARENLDLFASFYPKENLLNIPELFERVGLEESMNKQVGDFSKGMKMRLNFIRSIMHNPDILFFDEPTSGMDPVNAHIIKEIISEQKQQGKTIFITTHSMSTADQLCDRVSFIVDGSLQVTDAPEALKHAHGENKVVVQLANNEERAYSLDQLGHNREFLDFIQSGEVERINSLDASLEEVFIQITGKALKA